MRLHPRVLIVQGAAAEASILLHDIADEAILALLTNPETMPAGDLKEATAAITTERQVGLRNRRKKLEDLLSKHEITPGEWMMIVGDLLQSRAKYRIRTERHGDSDKPGGLA